MALSGFEVCRAAKKPLTPVDACMRERSECPLNELRMCDALAWLSECRLHVAAEDSLGRVTRHAPCLSGPSAPVFDAVMVGCEVVANAP